jgi:hypothetical protein
MSFWLNNDKIVVGASGNPVECATCPCGMDCVCTCSSCPDGAPSQWTFTLTGITNVGCVGCTNLNTTFTLNYVSGCTWSADVDICSATRTITFVYVAGFWVLTIPTLPADAVYNLSDASPDCLVAKTLSLVSSSDFGCTGWPATVTVTPVGSGECTTVCTACCSAGIPTTLYATLTNNANCACLNGVVLTMTYNSGGGYWSGTTSICGAGEIEIRIACTGPTCHFGVEAYCSGVLQDFGADTACDCSTMTWTFGTPFAVGTCCGVAGSITMVVSD